MKKRIFSLLLTVAMIFSFASMTLIPLTAITELVEPLAGRSLSNPTSPYGSRKDPFTGAQSFHYGIDLGIAAGTPVRATANGVVSYAGWKDSYGNIVIIRHASLGIYSFYCHLSGFNTTAGATVKAGQTVAYVGTTGDSTGNHLHFGMCTYLENYWPRNYVNPTPGVNYTYTNLIPSETVNTGEVPANKIVTAFASTDASTQYNSIKSKYPAGSYFSDNGTACTSHENCSVTGSCSCTAFNNGIQSKGFAGWFFYCMFGTAFPTYASLPIAIDDFTETVILRDYTPGTSGGSTINGMFTRKARLADIIVGEKSDGTKQCMIVESFNANGITFYACNTQQNNCLVSVYTLTWNDFAVAYPTMISIYRAATTQADRYTYPSVTSDIEVTSVSLNETAHTLTVGDNFTLTATLLPTDATNKSITWTSSNTAVAKVSNGIVTALATGSTNITATSGNGKTATCAVTVTAQTGGTTNTPTLYQPVNYSNYSNWVQPFSNKTMSAQLKALRTAAPDGTSFAQTVGGSTGNWAYGVWATYCLYGVIYPTDTTATIPANSWSTATLSGHLTLTASEFYTRTGYIKPNTMTYPAITTAAFYYRYALPGDLLVIRSSANNSTGNFLAVLQSYDAYGITITGANLPGTSGRGANTVNTVTWDWNTYVSYYGNLNQVYRVANNREYSYAVEPTRVLAQTPNSVQLASGTLNTEEEYITSISPGVISSSFAAKGYTSPMTAPVNLGSISVNQGQTTTLSFYVTGNGFGIDGVAYTTLTGLDARKYLTLNDLNFATIHKIDYQKTTGGETTMPSRMTVTIQGTAPTANSTIYLTNGHGNLAYFNLNVIGSQVSPESISLNKTSLALSVGSSDTLIATISPLSAADKTVTWTTSNENIATVTSGVVSAVGSGNVTITATTVNGKTATCSVICSAVEATSVSLNTQLIEMNPNNTAEILATITPTNTTNKSIVWTSSNAAVARVENGTVTALTVGNTTITATTANGKSATCSVTVTTAPIEVTQVTLNNSTLALTVGGTSLLTATVTPSTATNKTILWVSSNQSAATVTEGTVTALAAGTTTISAVSNNSKVATCEVTVSQAATIAVTGISINTKMAAVATGATKTLTATVSPSDATNKDVTWASSNTGTATVNNGVVTGVSIGTATISATAGGCTTSTTIKVVKAATSYNGIDVSKWQGVIDWAAVKTAGIDFAMLRFGWGSYTGQENSIDTTFVQNLQGARAQGIEVGCYFYSYAQTPLAATYEAQWLVSQLQAYPGVFTYPIAFDIEDPSQSSLGKQNLTDMVKNFCGVIESAGYYTSLYSNLNWLNNVLDKAQLASIDKWVAQWDVPSCTFSGPFGMWQYDSDGVVNGISGRVDVNHAYYNYPNIIINSGLNGFDISATSSGTPAAISPSGISLNKNSSVLTTGQTDTLSATITPSNATNKNVTWSSSDSSIATVNNGIVTGVSAGTAIITVTTSNSITASCTFTVTAPIVLPTYSLLTAVHSNYTDEGSITGTVSGKYNKGAAITLTSVPKSAAYIFDRWIDENGKLLSKDTIYTFNINSDSQVYAIFRKVSNVKIAVSFAKSQGKVLGVEKNGYVAGTQATLTAIAKDGYSFAGWYINGVLVEADSTYTFTVDKIVFISAAFKAI